MILTLENLTLPRDNFTLRIDAAIRDDTTGIFGVSGAGKTSLLHLLAGLARPTAGRIEFNDRTLVDVDRKIWVPPYRRRIGIVFQDARLFPHMTVRRNLEFGRRYRHGRPARVAFAEIVELLELEKILDSRPQHISGGESQRAALARTLLSEPEMLLLDEPFSAVDVSLRQQILPFLWRVRSRLNIPMLVISHDLPDILRLTRNLLLIDQGTVIGHGPVDELAFLPQASLLVKASGLVNVFELAVAGAEDGDTLRLTAGPLTFYVASGAGLAAGRKVKVTLAPEDVILTLTPITDTSARNLLSGRVLRVIEHPARSLCQVDLGEGITLLAEVTQSSFRRLALTPGLNVYCLFKATAPIVTPL